MGYAALLSAHTAYPFECTKCTVWSKQIPRNTKYVLYSAQGIQCISHEFRVNGPCVRLGPFGPDLNENRLLQENDCPWELDFSKCYLFSSQRLGINIFYTNSNAESNSVSTRVSSRGRRINSNFLRRFQLSRTQSKTLRKLILYILG